MKLKLLSKGKGLTKFLCLLGMGFFLSGCTLDANSVKLHTREEVQEIVEERYGDAQLLGVEEDRDKNQKIFTFLDTKYGFIYTVMSAPASILADGTVLGYNGAGLYFEYGEPFLKYFMEQERDRFERQGIELCDDLRAEKTDGRKFCLKKKLLLSTKEHWEEDLEFAWERVQAYKTIPELTREYKIEVYDSKNVAFYGTRKQEGFVTAKAQRIELFMEYARDLGGLSDITYLRTETKRVSEVPGLSEQSLYDPELERRDGEVTLYYFSHEGGEYFIADVWVAQYTDEENGGGRIYQYYQNYKYYRPVKE